MFVHVSHTDPHSVRKKSIHFALRILELFSDSRYSTSKCLKLARKVNQLFSAGLCEDLCVGERGRACKVYIDLCHPEYTKLGRMLLLFDRKIALNNSYLKGTLNKI
jgi:hypothetical protein